MAIRVACRECGESHQVKQEFAGRKFRCKGCGTKLRIPQSAARRSPRRKQVAPEYDYGEEEYEDYDDYEDEYSAPALPPPRRSAGKSRRSGSKRSSSQFPLSLPFMIGGGVFAFLGLLGFFIPVFFMILGFVIWLSGFALALWGGLKLLVAAFQEDVTCGLLYLFVPFYAPYFVISRWSVTARPFLANICGIALMVLPAFAFQAIKGGF